MKCLMKIQELNWSSGLIQTGNISFIISYSSLYLIVPWRYFINSGCFFLSNSYANYKYVFVHFFVWLWRWVQRYKGGAECLGEKPKLPKNFQLNANLNLLLMQISMQFWFIHEHILVPPSSRDLCMVWWFQEDVFFLCLMVLLLFSRLSGTALLDITLALKIIEIIRRKHKIMMSGWILIFFLKNFLCWSKSPNCEADAGEVKYSIVQLFLVPLFKRIFAIDETIYGTENQMKRRQWKMSFFAIFCQGQ